jgi:hypothetical protein
MTAVAGANCVIFPMIPDALQIDALDELQKG